LVHPKSNNQDESDIHDERGDRLFRRGTIPQSPDRRLWQKVWHIPLRDPYYLT
jgi:hypothetical protein